MEEIAVSAELNLVGKFTKSTTKGQPKILVKFEVWLNSYDLNIDIEITNQFNSKQLESLKKEFINKHDEKEESFTPDDDESRGDADYTYSKQEGVS